MRENRTSWHLYKEAGYGLSHQEMVNKNNLNTFIPMERDTSRYELHQGNRVVYVGITNNPERRMKEHEADKDFGKMVIVGPKVTRTSAEKWETERINTYKRNHSGERPIYNNNDSGK